MTKKKPAGKRVKTGRPSEYDPIYCQMLIDHMAGGYSYESFAGKIGKTRDTLYNWEKEFPEFLNAKSVGIEKSLYFWEQQGIDGLYSETHREGKDSTYTKSINATVWIFNMKNRHRWRDKSPEEIAEENDRPLRDLSDAELLRMREGKKT